MPSKKRKYNPTRIRANYTYSVEDIAELFDVADMTVFRWIADEGLKRIEGSKKYFIHGSELRKFIELKNSKNKQPCKDNEIYCCRCRKPQSPFLETLEIKNLPNRTIRVLGKCIECSTTINKVVSGKKWDQSHPLYANINADQKQHKGESGSPRKCIDRKDGQLCLSLTP